MSKLYYLEDLAELTVGYVGNMSKEYRSNGINFLRSLNIEAFKINEKDMKYISKEFNEEISKSQLHYEDLVMVRTGRPGACCIIPKKYDGSNCSDLVIIHPNKNKVNPYFLEAYINYISQKQILNNKVGAIQKHFNIGSAKKMIINLPSLETQEFISKLVRKINMKIQNNSDITTTLESMIKTIYDFWFIQFEFPNEEGKPYKSSGGTMVWNDELKRKIPKGWCVYTIKDCIKHIKTGLNPRKNFKLGQGDINYITVKNLTTNGTIDFSNCDRIDEAARKVVHARSDVQKGDILFASIAPLGRCVIVGENPDKWDINESIFSIRPNYKILSSEYLYMFFMSDYFIKKAEHSSTGSVFNGIRISTLEKMSILIPNSNIMKEFTDNISNLILRKYNNEVENKELTSLRDFLLPLLINEQVTFKDKYEIKNKDIENEMLVSIDD